jgi:four helix bundle protein
MELDEWVGQAPRAMREAAIWKVRAFQIASYVATLAAEDAIMLEGAARFARVVAQLVGAAGSIAANITEGYSRMSRKERIKYYEYALGSANETSSWYQSAANGLAPDVLENRLTYLARISQLLLTMIRNERAALKSGSSKRILSAPLSTQTQSPSMTHDS